MDSKIASYKTDTAYKNKIAYNYDKNRFTDRIGIVYDKLEKKQLKNAINKLSGKSKILEVGCGTGRFMQFCLEYGYETHGLDPSMDMLKITKQKLKDYKNVHYHFGEGAELNFRENSFNLVYSIRTLNQVESKEYAIRMITEMLRICKVNGYILIEFINTNSLSGFKKKGVKFSYNEFRNLLRQRGERFNIIELNGIFILSETILRKIPKYLYKLFLKLDFLLSSKFPSLTTRSFILIRKNEESE